MQSLDVMWKTTMPPSPAPLYRNDDRYVLATKQQRQHFLACCCPYIAGVRGIWVHKASRVMYKFCVTILVLLSNARDPHQHLPQHGTIPIHTEPLSWRHFVTLCEIMFVMALFRCMKQNIVWNVSHHKFNRVHLLDEAASSWRPRKGIMVGRVSLVTSQNVYSI